MADHKPALFTVFTYAVPLIDQKYRAAARTEAVRAIKELRQSHSLSERLESAIISQLANAYAFGFLKGVAKTDFKKAKKAQDAIRLLENQRPNAAKGAAVRRDRGAKTREAIRQLDEKYREKISKKGVRVQKIASELGISPRTVERHLKATS